MESRFPLKNRRTGPVTIERIVNSGIAVGQLLEVRLFENAGYEDGTRMAPAKDVQGFRPHREMTTSPGIQYSGYLEKILDDRIILTSGQHNKNPVALLGRWYIHEKCIYAIQPLIKNML